MQGGWRRSMYIYIVVAIVLQLGVQLNKGVDGGRYHMLYLPASLLAAGLFFEWLWFRAEARLPGRLWGAAGIILIGAYVYFMFGWQHWLTTWVLPERQAEGGLEPAPDLQGPDSGAVRRQ